MPHSIVVPLDGTPASEESLPLADRIAATTGATLHLVRVVEPSPEAVYPHEGTGLPPATRCDDPDRARATLQGARAQFFNTPGAQIEDALLEGDVVGSLTRYADAVDADLVLMASKASGPLGRFLLGSVADEVVQSIPLPVLIVQSGRGRTIGPWSEILVALDGSAAAAAVLPTVSALAQAFESRITLLRVLAVEIAGGYLPPGRAQQWERDMLEAEGYLDHIRNRLRDRGLRADSIVLTHPSPARAIGEVANEVGAGLVAMGTHGRGTLRSVVMGSVARRVVSDAPCPVLVRRGQ